MTEKNRFSMPLLMTAEKAAKIIRAGIDRRAGRIAFPLRLYAALRMLNALPEWLATRFIATRKAR
jgi:hypothetical protein